MVQRALHIRSRHSGGRCAVRRKYRAQQLQTKVQAAAPGSSWTGTGADAYANANDKQAHTLGALAHLDHRLGSEVDRSAAVVVAGRRELDAVKDLSQRIPVLLSVVGALIVAACTDSANPPLAPPKPPIDSLLLSVDEIRAVANLDQLSADGSPVISEPQPDPTPPDPCKAVLDQQVIFGSDFEKFRTVSYGASTDTSPGQIRGVAIVTQAVGQYPNTDDAQAAFDALTPAIQECKELRVKNYEYAVDISGESTLVLRSNVADIVDRVEGTTLIHVAVVGLANSGQIAGDVVQRISDRLSG